MEVKTKMKDKKDRWWIYDIFEFFIGVMEILFYLPREVLRFMKDL